LSDDKRWTLEGARAVMPDVRARTERAARALEQLLEGRREAELRDNPELRDEVEGLVNRWAREMEALGADVKGLWLVDFDNGGGYFCWQYPEQELEHFHTYEDGFEGRTKIQ